MPTAKRIFGRWAARWKPLHVLQRRLRKTRGIRFIWISILTYTFVVKSEGEGFFPKMEESRPAAAEKRTSILQ